MINRDDVFLRTVLMMVLLFMSVLVRAEEALFFVDTELSGGYDDNLTQAERERDTVEDHFIEGQFGVLFNHEINFHSAVSLKGFASGIAYETARSMNRGTLGAELSLRYQPTFGFLAPFFRFTLTGQIDDYKFEQRDSDVFKAQVVGTKRITDRLTSSLGTEYRYRDSDGSVFDTQDTRFFINGDLMLTKSLALYSTYSYLKGDAVSSAQINFCNGLAAGDIYGLIQSATALEIDQAFTKEFCGTWAAYRLDANTNAISIGLNQGVGHSYSLDASVLWARVNGEGDNDYYRRIYRLSLLARF